MSMAANRQAVLVFSNAAVLDRARRGWPRAFEQLLECNDFLSWTNPGFDVHVFTSPGFGAIAEAPLSIHYQEGSYFGDRLENAVQTLTDIGYRKVVIVGSDCPDLELGDIQLAFSALEHHRLVLGPDHRGGCYLIGLDTRERHLLHGIRWQQNSDCAELIRRSGLRQTFVLAVKQDLDTIADIELLAKSASRWRDLASCLLRAVAAFFSAARPARIHSRLRSLRIHWQIPPPPVSGRRELNQ
jgi:2-phospho-L-lactate guanylyltransferase (CobY/MobA/RfbA family)